jgi:SAM-dependent methyltransferase
MMMSPLLKCLTLLKGDDGDDDASPEEGWGDYFRWQFESSKALFAKFPASFDVRGARVLEIGCGTGGRAAYLAANGAASVVGIDVNAAEIAVAREHCATQYPGAFANLELRVSREDEPLALGEFDIVVLLDTMEHVVSPAQMMRLAHGYVRPGGRFFFSCNGWYHYRGSHTGLFPFVNVMFDDETILDVMRWRLSRPDYRPTRFDSNPPVERWRGLHDLRDRPGEYLKQADAREDARPHAQRHLRRGEDARGRVRAEEPSLQVARPLAPRARDSGVLPLARRRRVPQVERLLLRGRRGRGFADARPRATPTAGRSQRRTRSPERHGRA